jgi:hypothetical protein
VARLIASAIVVHTLSYAACSDAIEANSSDVRLRPELSGSAQEAPAGTSVSDSPAANCPATVAADPGQIGAIQWLAELGEDPATNASSVATDTRNDAYMTSAKGGTTKIGADGALLWSKSFGSLVAAADEGVVVAGNFEGSVDIDGTVLTSAGAHDVFIAKLGADGTVELVSQLGGSADERVLSLAATADGGAVLSGEGLGTVVLDGDHGMAWQKPFYGFVATDGTNVFVTGALTGSADFGGGPLTSAGGADVFAVKLDAAGSHQWSRRYGDVGSQQQGQAIATDPDGNLLIGGVFDGSIDFGDGAHSVGSCPAEVWCKQWGFVAKLDSNGETLFSRTQGPMRALSGVAANSTGAIFASGSLPGNVEPYRIPLLIALDATGETRWERMEWPETGLGAGRQVAVDGCDAVLWSVSARPAIEERELAYLAKLAE